MTLQISGAARTALAPYPELLIPYHRVGVEYVEAQVNTAIGRGFQMALPPQAPTVRVFTVLFETMRYYYNTDGTLDLETEPELNFGRLEDWYRFFRTTRPFWYNHPVFGLVKVRFREPLQAPLGIPGGLGLLQSFSIQLVEDPFTETKFNQALSFGENDFIFMNHLYSHRYISGETLIPLGGGFSYGIRTGTGEQRVLTLQFATMRFLRTDAGEVEVLEDPVNNAGRLLAFYLQNRMHRSFLYPHPVYGPIRVRFNQPLKFPEGAPNNLGYLPSFSVELIESED